MKRQTAALIVGLVAAGIATAVFQFQQRTRVIQGTWLYMFEGSEFIEIRTPGRECELYRQTSSWLHYNPMAIYPDYTYKRLWPSSGRYDSREYGSYRIEAFEVKFLGRKRYSLFGTGHMGSWRSEYEVDEMLSAQPIPNLHCMVP